MAKTNDASDDKETVEPILTPEEIELLPDVKLEAETAHELAKMLKEKIMNHQPKLASLDELQKIVEGGEEALEAYAMKQIRESNFRDVFKKDNMEDMFKISSVKKIEIERAIKRVAEIIDEDKKKEEEDEEYDPFY